MDTRLEEAWNNLAESINAFERAHNNRHEARLTLTRRRQVHGQNRENCRHSIAEVNKQIDVAIRGRKNISAVTADEYLARAAPYEEIIQTGRINRRKIYDSIAETRENADVALRAWVNTRKPYHETKWALEDARKEFRLAAAERAGVPSEWYSSVRVGFKNPSEDINIYFGDTENPKSPYYGHFILHPDGSVTRKRIPRRLTA